jgi:hypothetical protein
VLLGRAGIIDSRARKFVARGYCTKNITEDKFFSSRFDGVIRKPGLYQRIPDLYSSI